MIYKISHRTIYKYAYPVSVGNHVACLKPRSYLQNQLVKSNLSIHPTPHNLTERIDYFGNLQYFFTIEEPHQKLVVEANSEVVRSSNPLAAAKPAGSWEDSTTSLANDPTAEAIEACQYQFESPRIRIRPEFAAYALLSFTPGCPLPDALRDLTSRIHRDFRFDAKVTTVRTTIEEVFKKRRGVCQDFAHVQIACLRSIHLAARYVSGYLRTFPPPGRPRLVGADASHAWISVYCKGVGWLDMDPTNDVAPSDGHVTLAWGRDYSDVSPLRGLILGGGGNSLQVEVDMEPLPSRDES